MTVNYYVNRVGPPIAWTVQLAGRSGTTIPVHDRWPGQFQQLVIEVLFEQPVGIAQLALWMKLKASVGEVETINPGVPGCVTR